MIVISVGKKKKMHNSENLATIATECHAWQRLVLKIKIDEVIWN